jgi:hypothetical protein
MGKRLVRARIRRVVDYCAKLGRRRGVDDDDLFTMLPTSPRRSSPTIQTGPVAAVDREHEERGRLRARKPIDAWAVLSELSRVPRGPGVLSC